MNKIVISLDVFENLYQNNNHFNKKNYNILSRKE